MSLEQQSPAPSFVTSLEELCQLHEDSVVDTLVRIEPLRPNWERRNFQIKLPVSVVSNELVHSIFDWALLHALMAADQLEANSLLQRRIFDQVLLHKLSNSLRRRNIKQLLDFDVQLVVRRPTYNVAVQDGRIMVNQLPNLMIHVLPQPKLDAIAEAAVAVAIEESVASQVEDVVDVDEPAPIPPMAAEEDPPAAPVQLPFLARVRNWTRAALTFPCLTKRR